MMKNEIYKAQWIKKKIKVLRKYLQRTSEITFHRVNVIDMYYYKMNHVDVEDQLRGSYRFDHWMRKSKWRWSMFSDVFKFFSLTHLWFTKVYDTAWKKSNWPLWFSQVSGIGVDWSRCTLVKTIWWHRTHWFQEKVTKIKSTIWLNTRRSICSTTSSLITDPGKKSPRVTDKNLAPNLDLRVRLQQGEHWPTQENL